MQLRSQGLSSPAPKGARENLRLFPSLSLGWSDERPWKRSLRKCTALLSNFTGIWSSGWKEYWERPLVVTRVSTSWAEVIFRLKWRAKFERNWKFHGCWNVSHLQVFLRTPLTRTVKFKGFKPFPIVLKSKHFYCGDNQVSLVIQTCCHWWTKKWPQCWEININF